MSDQSAHQALCERAARWLSSAMRCTVVLGGIASCIEVPDAIGWTSSSRAKGSSIVIECKCSMSDFYRDARKTKRRRYNWHDGKDEFVEIKRMGDQRYFMCPSDLISKEAVAERYPDHGLLHVKGRNVHMMREAPLREHANHAFEVRLLHFALRHVQANILAAGMSVNMRELTKHPFVADRSGLERAPESQFVSQV